jgi:hypothetical protein
MKKFERSFMKFFVQVGIAIIILNLTACITKPTQSLSTKRIYIYKDDVSSENRVYWTNIIMMVPNGATPVSLIRDFTTGDESNPFAGRGESIRIDFELKPKEWAGVAVASCPDCWGQKPCPQPPAVYMDIGGATRLVFYARGERGGEVIEAKVAILGNQPCGDSTLLPAESGYIRLTNEWKEYSICLKYFNLSRVITPFAIFVVGKHNQQSVRVFLDEIYFEIP